MRIENLFPVPLDLEVKYPDGGGTGIVMRVISRDNATFRNKQKQIMQLGQGDKEPSIAEIERFNCELAACCVVGWTGLEDANGPIPFSYEKAVELFMMPELTFVREQVEEFISSRARFFRRSNNAVGDDGAANDKAAHTEQDGNFTQAGA